MILTGFKFPARSRLFFSLHIPRKRNFFELDLVLRELDMPSDQPDRAFRTVRFPHTIFRRKRVVGKLHETGVYVTRPTIPWVWDRDRRHSRLHGEGRNEKNGRQRGETGEHRGLRVERNRVRCVRGWRR